MSARTLAVTQRSLNAWQAFHIYVWAAMVLLFVQGTGSWILRLRPDIEAATPWLLATLMNGNLPHAILHATWGALGLIYLYTMRLRAAELRLGFTFGIFYTTLAFLGVIFANPFGLRLAWQENVFHFTVGPLMLLLSYLAWRSPERALWRGRASPVQVGGP